MAPFLLNQISFWGLRDPFSAVSHGLAAAATVGAAVALLARAHRLGTCGSTKARLAIYSLALFATFTSSTLFHTFDRPPSELTFFKKLDHAIIFLLIAATASVVYGMIDRPWTRGVALGTWGLAIVAALLKVTVWPMPLSMSATIYLAVGWTALGAVLLIARETGWRPLRPLMYGAAVLSLGAVFFVLERPVVVTGVIEGHELFHIAVVAGVAAHYLFIYRNCGGLPCGEVGERETAPSSTSDASCS